MTWNHDISSAPRGETDHEDILIRIATEIDVDWVQGLFGTTNDNGAQVISKAISMYLDATNSVIVPREPTEEMIGFGWDVEELHTPDRMYRAMIAAAPSQFNTGE